MKNRLTLLVFLLSLFTVSCGGPIIHETDVQNIRPARLKFNASSQNTGTLADNDVEAERMFQVVCDGGRSVFEHFKLTITDTHPPIFSHDFFIVQVPGKNYVRVFSKTPHGEFRRTDSWDGPWKLVTMEEMKAADYELKDIAPQLFSYVSGIVSDCVVTEPYGGTQED